MKSGPPTIFSFISGAFSAMNTYHACLTRAMSHISHSAHCQHVPCIGCTKLFLHRIVLRQRTAT